MSDVFIVAPLAGADAMAVRTGDDVLVHMSPTVPQWAHTVVAGDLRRAVHLTEGRDAVVTLPQGAAAMIALDAARPLPRRTHSAGMLAAVAAAVVLPLGGFGLMFLGGGAPRGDARLESAPEAAEWPTKPAPHRVPAPVTGERVGIGAHSTAAPQEVPVSIHPPAAIARNAPQSITEPPVTSPPKQPVGPSGGAPGTLSVPVTCPAPANLPSDLVTAPPSAPQETDPAEQPSSDPSPADQQPTPAPEPTEKPAAETQPLQEV